MVVVNLSTGRVTRLVVDQRCGQPGHVAALSCPFPVRLHPRADVIEAHLRTWLAAQGLTVYNDAQPWLLAAACHPDGRLDQVQLLADLVVWQFYVDDRFDEPAEVDPWLGLRCHQAVDDPEEPVEGHCAGLLNDIARRLRTEATPAQYQRFQGAVCEYMLAQSHDTTAANPRISMREYRMLRRYVAACPIFFALLDFGAGVELPDSLWRQPDLVRLTRLAAEIVALTNDVYSHDKESARQRRAPVNLVTVLARDHRVPVGEAVELATAHVQGLYAVYDDWVSQLADRNPAVELYLAGLEAWLAGNHHFHQHSARYATTEASV